MLVPSLPGWKVETVGDDICWMHVGEDGRLWAINPEAGMFGVAPGTSLKTNPNAMRSLSHDVIFTNVALRADGRRGGKAGRPRPARCSPTGVDDPGQQGSDTPRRTPTHASRCPLTQCPSVDRQRRRPAGRADLGDRVRRTSRQARAAGLRGDELGSHGVYVGATMVSETTAAATGAIGVPRNDPMAMLPFCGYNMGDYFGHWLAMGQTAAQPPKIFHVNWFRTRRQGKFLWPGFGDNVRVLEWILRRTEDTVGARPTPIGFVPEPGGLNTQGLDLNAQQLAQLLHIDWNAWSEEAVRSLDFLARFGERVPAELLRERAALLRRLKDAQA